MRHGEGKLVAPGELLERIESAGLVPVRYLDPRSGRPTVDYPANPNGSPAGIAGLCDPSGRLFGLMPHPERASEHVITPRGYSPDGRLIFQSLAVALRRGW